MSSGLLIVCLVSFVIAGIARSVATLSAMVWLTRSHQAPEPGKEPLVVLLPALREQHLVDETLEYFERLDYPADSYRVLVVTTERERREHEVMLARLLDPENSIWDDVLTGSWPPQLCAMLPQGVVPQLEDERELLAEPQFRAAVIEALRLAPTTGNLAAARAARSEVLVCIEAPAEWQLKAGQLRYATSHLETILDDWRGLGACRYVGVYDFDARPAQGALHEVAAAARSGAVLLQQPGLTVPRRGGVSGDGQIASFSLLDGQLHSRLAFRLELSSLLVDRWIRGFPRAVRAILGSSVHTVGNGLYFDRQRLPSLGGLPTVVDDLALGWRAAAIGASVEPIRSVVFYDAYPSASAAVVSRQFICSGYLRAVADIRAAPDRVKAALPVHLIRIYSRLVQWTIGPLTRMIVLVVGWVYSPRITASVVFAIYLTLMLDVGIVRRAWTKLGRPVGASRATSVVTLIAAPVALFWYGAGARKAVVQVILARAHGGSGRLDD